MDLYCPHCTRRVTVPDDQAGQATSCPLCAKQFMAPTLAPAGKPAPAPPPAPNPSPMPSAPKPEVSYGVESAPEPSPSPSPPAPSMPAKPTAPPPAPTLPGEYTRSCACQMTGEWLAFVPAACVLAIFVLSPFNWHYSDSRDAFSLWTLSFGQSGQGQFLGYTILMILCLPVTIVVTLFDKGWIVTPPQIAPVMLWKNLIVGVLLCFGLMAMCTDYVYGYRLEDRANPIALAMDLAFRLQFIAMVASFLMFWLNWRKTNNLPAPKFEAHW